MAFKNPGTDDSDSDYSDSDDDRKQRPKPKNGASLDILKVVQAAESAGDLELRETPQRINRDSTPADVDASSARPQIPSLQLAGKRKKSIGGTKIIMGQAIKNSRRNNSESIQEKPWRRADDRYEYHVFHGPKDDNVQNDDPIHWNTLNGTSSSSVSQVSTNRQRSVHRKANRDIAGLLQESPGNTRRSRESDETPITIDITNSDSEDDDIVMDDNQSMEFTLKRLAINNRVRNQQDCQPMIKYDFELNTMLLSFNKSKLDVTKGRSEILIGMADVREMSYFEMNDAAVQNNINIDLDLDSFIYLHAVAERPGARSRTKEYNFELEFEEDEHLRDLIQAVEDSRILTPSQTQPDDIKMDAKALIEDSRTKYKLSSQVTTQTTQSINKDSAPPNISTSSASTSNSMSQNSSMNLFNLRKVKNRSSGSSTERTTISKGAKIVAAKAITNSNGPTVSKKQFLDLQEENKRLKESEKRAKEEVKRAQNILLQAGAIVVDESNDGDGQHKAGTKATTRSLLAVQELRNKNEGLEDKVKNFEEGIAKAKKVLEQAWAIVI